MCERDSSKSLSIININLSKEISKEEKIAKNVILTQKKHEQ